MPARLRLPNKKQITCVNPKEEPTRYYYWPVVGWFYRKRLQMVLDVFDERLGRVLEVAYGSGIFLPSLAEICDDLYAIDLHDSREIVERNLEKMSVNAKLSKGDALSMTFEDEYFDCAVSISLLEHLPDPGKAIDEMLRVVKPGGLLVLGFPSRNWLMDSFFQLLGFDPRKIHPSSHIDILAALDKRELNYELATLPAKGPVTLYNCCAVKKGGTE